MKTIALTAPSVWAPYLINGDGSGLDQADMLACDDWMESNGLPLPVACEDAGFRCHHDADVYALAADCQTYAFIAE